MSEIILEEGDALELIKAIPDNSIHLIVTDPPYDIKTTGGGGSVNRVKKLNESLKQLDEADITKGYDISSYGEEVLRIQENVNAYFFCNKTQIPDYFDFYVKKHKCKFDIIVWHKCLHGSMKVYKKNKSEYIENIKMGDEIWDGEEFVRVKRVTAFKVKEYVTLKLSNGHYLKSSREHPFFRDDYSLVCAEDLKCGDKITILPLPKKWKYNPESTVEIVGKRISKSKGTLLYDLEVESDSNTFLTTSGVLTHNCNALPTYSNKYLSDCEYCLHFYKGKGTTFPESYEDAKTVYIAPINQSDKKLYKHPTIKPLPLVEKIIRNSSREGDLVLDMFMGSGTTGVASKHLNRDFIGFELNHEFFLIAKERIDKE